jgi:hypothetical protein
MDDTIRRLTKVLGATGVESMGHDTRFTVEGADGSKLKVNIEAQQQRFMAVLVDAKGVTRATVDVAPVKTASEDPNYPGRVTLHLATHQLHVESKPSLAVELVSEAK